jgi:hypothetical protein
MVEFETNQILENLPMIALIVVIIVTYTPQVPSWIKLPILIVGIVGSIGVSFVTEKVLQYEASSFVALKCNIYPLNKTVTFFIKEQQGNTSSVCIDRERGIYKTGPLSLAAKVPFQIFGRVQKIIIEHRLPFDERVKTFPGTVIYKGVQIKHRSVALLTLELDPNKGIELNLLDVIPVFKLLAAPQDYWILKGKLADIGEIDFYE